MMEIDAKKLGAIMGLKGDAELLGEFHVQPEITD